MIVLCMSCVYSLPGKTSHIAAPATIGHLGRQHDPETTKLGLRYTFYSVASGVVLRRAFSAGLVRGT